MRTLYIAIGLLAVLVLAGCENNNTTGDVVNNDSDGLFDNDWFEDNDTDETNDTEDEDLAEDNDWCREGEMWSMNVQQNDTSAEWRIVGLEDSGDYEGYCHVLYTAQTEEGEVTIDYWFDESGENGYYEMESGGQTFTQEWHANT